MFCQSYIFPFLATFLITVPAVLAVKHIAEKLKIMDDPQDAPERKLHKKSVPLMGGTAIFAAFFLVAAYYIFYTARIIFPGSSILLKHLTGIFLGSCTLLIGGFLDDKYKLKPAHQIIFPIVAAVVVIMSGVSVNYISNPLGGIIRLDLWKIVLLKWRGLPYKISLPSDIITFIWILGMIYTTKLLDGLDGLVSGITVVGALVIFGASLGAVYVIPQVALLSIILSGACAGFLIFNFNPAKIFLGEGGSTLCGFLLVTLAILAQGKMAVTLLVMGIPILDVAWVIGRRVFSMRCNMAYTKQDNTAHGKIPPCPPRNASGLAPLVKGGMFAADRKHLHHRLLDAGFSHRGAVIFLYIMVGGFGLISLFLQSKGRLLALGVMAIVMAGLGMWVIRKRTNKHEL
ncbi:MAG: MraY family glycosyltransferase [bacterium]